MVTLSEEIRELKTQRIVDAIAVCHGNKTAAAKMLGLNRTTLVESMRALGLTVKHKQVCAKCGSDESQYVAADD